MSTTVLSGSGVTVGSWFTVRQPNAQLQFTVTSVANCELQASFNQNSASVVSVVSVNSNSIYKIEHINMPLRVVQNSAGTTQVNLL